MASSILSIQTFAAPSLSSTLSSSLSSFSKGSPLSIPSSSCFSSNTNTNHSFAHRTISLRPLAKASLLSSFSWPFLKKVDRNSLKEELLDAIATLDRGADASPEDEFRVDKIARELESVNPTKEPLKSPLLNGKWELLYTTSASILKKKTLKILRPSGPIYQAINADTLRAQNMETWPYFSQVTANLTPLSGRKVAVKFDVFKVAGLISIKAPDTARGELEITYLDEELRISRGDKGNLFILKMVDSTYRVPL